MSKLFGVSNRKSDEHGVEDLLKQVQQRSMSCSAEDRKALGNMVKRVHDHKKPNNVVEALSKKLSSVTGSISNGGSGSTLSGNSSHHSVPNNSGSFHTTTTTSPTTKSPKAIAIEQSLAAAAASGPTAPQLSPSSSGPSSLTQQDSNPDGNPVLQSPLQASLLNAKNKTTDLFRNLSKNLQNPLVSPTGGQQQQQQQQQQQPRRNVGQLLRGFGSPRPVSKTRPKEEDVVFTAEEKDNQEKSSPGSSGVILREFRQNDPSPTIVDLPPPLPKKEEQLETSTLAANQVEPSTSVASETKEEDDNNTESKETDVFVEDASGKDQGEEDETGDDKVEDVVNCVDESDVKPVTIATGQSNGTGTVRDELVSTSTMEKMNIGKEPQLVEQNDTDGGDYGEEKKIEHLR